MISRYQVLARRIQVEISDIERTVDTAMNLLPDRMEDLVTNLPTIWHRVRTELQAFINFLKQLSEAE